LLIVSIPDSHAFPRASLFSSTKNNAPLLRMRIKRCMKRQSPQTQNRPIYNLYGLLLTVELPVWFA